jgi:hypothetical protein
MLVSSFVQLARRKMEDGVTGGPEAVVPMLFWPEAWWRRGVPFLSTARATMAGIPFVRSEVYFDNRASRDSGAVAMMGLGMYLEQLT